MPVTRQRKTTTNKTTKRSRARRKPTTARAKAKAAGVQSRTLIPPELVQSHLAGLFENNLHAKRVHSLSNGVVGVMHAASLSVQAIGHGLSIALGKHSKHAIKQVARLLSNAGVEPWQ